MWKWSSHESNKNNKQRTFEIMKNKMRPALRYHGGKWRIAPWIISYFPEHKIYVEPYAGAASVLLRKERAYAEVINDLNDEVVNVFKVLRDQGDILGEKLKLTPWSRSEYIASYSESKNKIERARKTIFKSFASFGADSIKQPSGFRSITSGDAIPSRHWKTFQDAVPFFIERLQGVVIECRPAEQVIKERDTKDTLFYIDPPYVISSRSSPQHGYSFEMSDEDHKKLATILHSVKGKVILSGYDCELYQTLYASWRKVKKISRADGAREREETLWFNF